MAVDADALGQGTEACDLIGGKVRLQDEVYLHGLSRAPGRQTQPGLVEPRAFAVAVVTGIERGDQLSGQSRTVFRRQLPCLCFELEDVPVHAVRLYAAGETPVNTPFRNLCLESAL